MRKFFAAIIAILFSLIFAVLLLEGGIRLFRLARPAESAGWFFKVPDPVTGWGHIANSQGRWFNDLYEYDAFVQYNSRELRVPESLTYEKPAGVYRVMILGDSFVEGLQVNVDQTFAQQLGAHLAQSGMMVEVIGAGTGGWGTDQSLLWFENEGIKYQPDSVILAVFPGNDFMNNTQALEVENFGSILKPFFHLENGQPVLENFPYDPDKGVQAPAAASDAPADQSQLAAPPRLAEVGSWLHDHSALYRYLDPRVRIVAPSLARALGRIGLIQPGQESKAEAADHAYIPVAYGIDAQPLSLEWEGAVDLTAALIARLKSSVEGSGATFGAVIVEAPEQVYPHQWQSILDRFPAMQGKRWDPLQPNRLAAQILAQVGVPTLNLLPLFQARADQGGILHFPQDGHWTVYGHELAGAALFNFVGESGLIPGAAGMSVSLPSPLTERSLWRWFVLLILALLVGSLLWSIVKNGPIVWFRDVSGRFGTAGELMVYMVKERQFLLLPLVVVLLLFGGLLIIAQASVVGPFIYTLF